MAKPQPSPIPAGDRAVGFINRLTHTSGKFAGRKFHLRQWQEFDIIRPFFGTINSATGLRQYRTLYLELPRKNGKSELIAGCGVYLLMGDNEYGAQIYGAAADKAQASLIFDVAAQMVRNDTFLRNLVSISDTRKNMVFYAMNSFYRAISKHAANKHGYNAHAILIDEYHTFRDDELFDVLSTSQDARQQPVRIIITTAGQKKIRGIETPAWRMHQYALKVKANPELDPTFLPVIYAADPDDPWDDPKTWAKANPALGDFKEIAGLEQMVREAREMPDKKRVFMQLHLNIWVDEGVEQAIPQTVWDENAGDFTAGPELPAFLHGRTCYGALDLASTTDFTALALLFPPAEKDANGNWVGRFHVHMMFWVPAETIERRTTGERLKYAEWRDAGFITATPGNVTDYAAVRSAISGHMDETGQRKGGLVEKVQFVDIAYDPFNASHLVNELVEDGANMVSFRQGFLSMSPPTKELLRFLQLRHLAHGNNPVLAWMATNLVLATDEAGNYKPDRRNSAEKIDGMVALIMTIGRWLANTQTAPSRSRFEDAPDHVILGAEPNESTPTDE